MLYRGTSLIRNCLPPQDHHRALGIGLLRILGGKVLTSGTPVLSLVVLAAMGGNVFVFLLQSVHKNRLHYGGGAATSAGGWPD